MADVDVTLAIGLAPVTVAANVDIGDPEEPPTPPGGVTGGDFNLVIGRTGMDVALSHPYAINQRPSGQKGRIVTIQGHIKESATLKDANALRESLLAQAGRLLPVTCVVDPSINGFYYLTDASVDLSHSLGSLVAEGFFPYSITLEYAATEHLVMTFTGGVMPNDHNITDSPLWMGRSGLEYMATGPTPSTGGPRTGSEGPVRVGQIAPGGAFRFGVKPVDFYHRGVRFFASGDLIAGENIPSDIHDPMNWELHNTLLRVVPISGGLRLAMWSQALADFTSTFDMFIYNHPTGGSPTPFSEWDVVYVLRNDHREVTLRLGQKRISSGGMRMLDVTLRIGMRHTHCYLQTTGDQQDMRIQAGGETSVVTAPWGLRRSADDADGNRWILGTRHAHSTNTGTSTITKPIAPTDPSPRNIMDFFAGHIAGGSNAAAYDLPAQLGQQYLAYLSERLMPLSPSDTSIVR